MKHRWLSREHGGDPGGIEATEPAPRSQSPGGVDPLVARVLLSRGFAEVASMRAFCDPRMTSLHDPSLLPGLDRACERILDSLRRRAPLVIYGDYDVDGVTAASILFNICRAIAPEGPVQVYIPHRVDEGYGLNGQAIEQMARDGADLVVSVDCGVTARAEADIARRAGLDLIITDHHACAATEAELPQAFAVVHPRAPGSAYPFGDLCGAGVAFKIAWRLATLASGTERVSPELRELLLDLLALSALGAIADVVPLVDENRVIARFGLSRMRSTRFVGLNALIEASRLDNDRVTTEDVGFRLAPRLNACGRMGHALDAVELFTTDCPKRAEEIATALTATNERRRALERSIVEQAMQMAEQAGMIGDDRRAIVLAHDDWHTGVIGIVCSRLVDRFGRPTILMQRQGEVCKGSCRSIEGFDMHAALGACADHLTTFGGHVMAAGLAMDSARLEAFTEAFTAVANDRLSPDDLTPTLRVDCGAALSELSPRAVERLERLGPFGAGNPSPRIMLRGLTLSESPRPLGARGKHAKFTVRQDGRTVRLLGWGWGERAAALPTGCTVDAVVEPKLNRWNGRTTVEPLLCDLRLRK